MSDFLNILRSCGAIRYLRDEPVPEGVIEQIIGAAVCAPSPGNSQGWEFVVVRDPQLRARMGALFREAISPLLPSPTGSMEPGRRRMLEGAHHLLRNAERVPVWVLVCGRNIYPPSNPDPQWIPAAVYPAAQNLTLAARSLGVGSVFTTYHRSVESELRDMLQIPGDVVPGVTVALGYPERDFFPVRRRPLNEVVHTDGW